MSSEFLQTCTITCIPQTHCQVCAAGGHQWQGGMPLESCDYVTVPTEAEAEAEAEADMSKRKKKDGDKL
jgi:hypothetical protein